MAEVRLTEHDEALIEAYLVKYDIRTHVLTRHVADLLPSEDWRFIVEHEARKLREHITICLLQKAFLEEALRRGLYDSIGVHYYMQGPEKFFPNEGNIRADERADWDRFCDVVNDLPHIMDVNKNGELGPRCAEVTEAGQCFILEIEKDIFRDLVDRQSLNE